MLLSSSPKSPAWGEARKRILSEASLEEETKETTEPPLVSGLSKQADEIIKALREPHARLPQVWYLYDDRGSELFEEITKQPEYYVCEKEMEIFQTNALEIALFPDEVEEKKNKNNVRTFHSALIELGAGSGKKMRALLDATEGMTQEENVVCTYIPMDYSAGALQENATVWVFIFLFFPVIL